MSLLLLQQGCTHPSVVALRTTLVQALGPAAAPYAGLATGGDLFDATLGGALRCWQAGRGLIADGLVGPRNLHALGLEPPGQPGLELALQASAAQLLFPGAKAAAVSCFLPYVLAALRATGLCSRALVLAALGTIRAETSGFVPISEFPSKYNTAPGGAPFGLYDGRLGNRRGEGALFKGRGFVQLTGRSNYDSYGRELGLDLLARPDLANAPEVAALLLALFLRRHRAALEQALARGDYAAARRLVNGGTHGLDRFSSVFALAQANDLGGGQGGAAAAPLSAAAGASDRPAAAPVATAAPHHHHPTRRRFNARPDTPDLNDRPYTPPPVNLLAQWPAQAEVQRMLPVYAQAGLILNQGHEGACTGFGLAGVVNYLRWVQAGCPGQFESVSPRMLYNMARRYDENSGDTNQGASCRSAITGWFNHGVCLDSQWPYQSFDPGPPRFGYAQQAQQHTLGVYYRVQISAITDLQAALQTVGAVYASCFVHEGWARLPAVTQLPQGHHDLPVIAFDGVVRRDAGHAFALVGFNERGFVLQNSWGPAWGAHGFAVISYEDWLAHGMDAWVVALGVPGLVAGGAAGAAHRPHHGGPERPGQGAGGPSVKPPWTNAQLAEHALMVGNDGRMSRYLTPDERSRSLAYQVTVLPDRWFRAQPADSPKRLLIYVHGGLNSEADGLKRCKALGQVFERNGCYPLFVVWKTGLLESLADLFSQWRHRQPAATGWGQALWAQTDALIESTVGRPLARPIWSEIKENAQLAWQGHRAGDQLVHALADLIQLWGDQLQIHLVGHSAGSLWLGHLITALQATRATTGRPALDAVPSVHLYAPACTVAFANQHYAGTDILPRTHIALLSDPLERADNTALVYRKSLLYLVSNALEADRRTPILGLQRVFDTAQDEHAWDGAAATGETLRAWHRAVADSQLASRLQVLHDDKVLTALPDVREPASHGCFDNDIPLLTSTLQTICGGGLVHRIRDLRGY
ncbi:C1 family peptidase [Curvibacter gracilis]|uniref:C1 family peptidase n=1 Tax=Curvibacter gracilis TaxID=230310 RepID=UPI0004831A52|nr:C1 family peptidase [Curvibacter gracilis]